MADHHVETKRDLSSRQNTENAFHTAIVTSLGPHVVKEIASHHDGPHHNHMAATVVPVHGRDRAPSTSNASALSGTIPDSVTVTIPVAGGAAAIISAKQAAQHVAFDLSVMRQAKKTSEQLKAMKADVREFYEQQNELIDFYEEVEEQRAEEAMHAEQQLKAAAQKAIEAGQKQAAGAPAEGDSPASPRSSEAREAREAAKAVEEARTERLVNLAINLSFAANVFLLVIKVYAAVSSNSLAVIASTVDSVMDLVSGAVVWIAAWLATRRNHYLFPVGKSRYEPIGIIVFAALMGAASLQLISQGFTTLADGLAGKLPANESDARTYGVLVAIIGIKGALYFFCTALKKYSTSVGALAMDHFADVVTNLAPLIAVLIVKYYPIVWWVDPAACILMSVYMVWMWADAAKAQIALITGQAATPRELSEITFLALTHSPAIIAVDTVLAYQLGNKLQAEVDIVLPKEMLLCESHDIGESLQCKVERLDNVERCFVHADYEWRDHKRDQEHWNPYDQPSYAPPED